MKTLSLVLLPGMPLGGAGFPRHTLSGGFVEAFRFGTSSYFLKTTPGITAGYGFRFHRHFQVDAGIDWLPRAVGDSVCCRYIDNARDNLFLFSFGGRAVFGPDGGRWEVVAGAGGACMHHSIPDEVEPYIGPTRDAGGGYAVAGGDVGFGRNRRYRLGIFSKVYLIHVNRYQRARIVTLAPQFSIRF